MDEMKREPSFEKTKIDQKNKTHEYFNFESTSKSSSFRNIFQNGVYKNPSLIITYEKSNIFKLRWL